MVRSFNITLTIHLSYIMSLMVKYIWLQTQSYKFHIIKYKNNSQIIGQRLQYLNLDMHVRFIKINGGSSS